ncbi:MAG: hypothetical protein HN480_06285, partial [Gammaproteobacteria bacterium]|nr:hypothetical protein [Gammaproteobacteria bacterium]
MIDINNFSNRALLVHIDKYPIDINNSKEEFQDLVGSANIECINKIYLTQKNKSIGIKYYIGKGDAELIEEEVKKSNAKLV